MLADLAQGIAERNQIALQDVATSSDVQNAISAFKNSLIESVMASTNNPLVERAIETYDLGEAVLSATRDFYDLTHGQFIYGSVELINFTASFLQDQISSYLLQKTGLRINVPLSSVTNLAGTVAGVYLYGFTTGS